MKVLYRALLPLAFGVVLACGSEGKRTRCSKATEQQDCGLGMECSDPVAGEKGVCVPKGYGNCLQDCGNAGICNAAGDCKPRYLVEVLGPADASVLGSGAQQVVVRVTRGGSEVSVAETVQLKADGVVVSGAPDQRSLADAIDTYTWTYTPPSGVEQDVSFTATVTGTGTDASTISENSSEVKLAVDTKGPTIEVIPDSGGSFAGGSDMTFEVRVADAHPPTEALQATVGTTTVALSYQGPNAGASVYRGTLTRAAMGVAGLGCSVSVTVTAQDTVGNSSTSSAAQMAFTCGSATVCSPESTYACQPKYTVAITSPAAGTLVSGTQAVTVTVTLGTAPPAVTAPQVRLAVNGATSGAAVSSSSHSGLVYTYNLTYNPPSQTEGDYSLTAIAAPTTDSVASPAVSVSVDTKAPVVSVELNNGKTEYLRTDTIDFTVTVTDRNLPDSTALTAVLQTTDSSPVTLVAVGLGSPTIQTGSRSYVGSIDLSQNPFGYYSKTFRVNVSLKDKANNTGSESSSNLTITRQRWAPQVVGGDVTSPAVFKDTSGDLVVGTSATSTNPGDVVTTVTALVRGTGATRWNTLSTDVSGPVSAPPVVGAAGIWVMSGSKLCLIDPGSGHVRTVVSGQTTTPYCCSVPGVASGTGISITPVVTSSNGVDTAIVGGNDGKLYSLASNTTPPANCSSQPGGSTSAVVVSPVLDGASNMYWADQSKIYSSRSWTVANAGVVSGGNVTGSFALDSASAWTTPGLNAVNLTTGAVAPWNFGTGFSAGGIWPVAVADNDILIGRQNGGAFSLTRAGSAAPTGSGWKNPSLGADNNYVRGPLVLRDKDDKRTFVVPTVNGSLYQFGEDGTLLWSEDISAGELHEGNISTEVNGTVNGVTQRFSTAYFGSTTGTVYAVIVDGVLDTNAPWPKVRHDPQNTGNAGTTISP